MTGAATGTPADPAPSGAPTTVETLPEAPTLGSLYARAASGAVRAKLPGAPTARSGGLTVPDVALRVAGIGTGDAAARDRLTAYDRLVGEEVAPTLPSGYLHVLAFPTVMALMVRDDFPLPVLGMVHLANAAELRRPVEVGETLEVVAWAQHLRPHRKGTQVELVAELRPAGAGSDDAAWRGVSTYLAPGAGQGGSGPDAAASGSAGTSPGTGAGHEEWTAPVPTERWTLDAGTGRRYAAVSGDVNPIHLSPLTAKALGFPRAIAHGMYTAARALASVGRARGDAYDWDVTFAKPVLLPGVVDVAVRPAPRAAGVDAAAGSGRDPWTYVGWNARKGLRHLEGTVTPR